jgi:hypothetical protein
MRREIGVSSGSAGVDELQLIELIDEGTYGKVFRGGSCAALYPSMWYVGSGNAASCPCHGRLLQAGCINPVRKEDIKHILQDSEFLTQCLRNVLYDGIPNLLEKIHLDPEHPENNNVSITRVKHPAKMKVFSRDKKEKEPSWKELDSETALQKIIYRGCDILVSHNNKLYRIKEENGATIDDEETYHLS